MGLRYLITVSICMGFAFLTECSSASDCLIRASIVNRLLHRYGHSQQRVGNDSSFRGILPQSTMLLDTVSMMPHLEASMLLILFRKSKLTEFSEFTNTTGHNNVHGFFARFQSVRHKLHVLRGIML